jgi:hypothetical protein
MGILTISAKCSDLSNSSYKDKKGNVTKSNDYSYVPRGINIGGGDYVELSIDTETGKILNWKPITDKKIILAIKNANN